MFLSYIPIIIPHNSTPSCSCYYEHTYGVECLCECHSFEAQLSNVISAIPFFILLFVFMSFGMRLMRKIYTSF